ncbi:MAG: hypothetical protein ABH879_04920 [archaeon]
MRFIVFFFLLFFSVSLAGAEKAYWAVGRVHNADDGTPSLGRTVTAGYPGDSAKATCRVGVDTSAEDEDIIYMCNLEDIGDGAWAQALSVIVEVPDSGDSYHAGPVTTKITGNGYDLLPDMKLHKSGLGALTGDVVAQPASAPSISPGLLIMLALLLAAALFCIKTR